MRKVSTSTAPKTAESPRKRTNAHTGERVAGQASFGAGDSSEKEDSGKNAVEETRHGALTSKLAQSQARRLRRVLDAASKLADQGGFEGVRLRDVAEASGVALGTLYRYFDSKEAILIHTIAEDLAALEDRFRKDPVRGATAFERVIEFFELLTRYQMLRPHYVRAAVRAVSFAGGETHALPQVAAFHLRMIGMTLAALRGEAPRSHIELAQEEHAMGGRACVEREQAALLELIWFGALVMWAGNLCEADWILQKIRTAARLILETACEAPLPTEKGIVRSAEKEAAQQ